MRVMSWTRLFHGLDLFYLTLLLWTRRMDGLADFSSKTMMMITHKEEEGDEIDFWYVWYVAALL